MDETPDQPTLTLGKLQIVASTHTRKRLFGRRPHVIATLVVTIAEYRTEFYAREVAELADGPIVVSAVSAQPEGDYFLVSPTVVDPNSAIGASLQHQHFDKHGLLLLHRDTILAEVSTAQQADLLSWLERIIESQ